MNNNIITRIAPSPTGPTHIGTIRTALFNFLYAKKHKGKFIVRIEDTDTERSSKQYEEEVLESLKQLGITYDEIVRQSDRKDIYKKYITTLIENKKAYISKEPSKKEPAKEIEVIRFNNTHSGMVSFQDTLRGVIQQDVKDLGDFVIARSIQDPLYHLAVVIDDAEMGVTHVIRGEDHISNTARQIVLQDALLVKRPLYTHVPLILTTKGEKMSKRDTTVESVLSYIHTYSPLALLNTLARLGWGIDDDTTLFTLEELIQRFDITKLQKGGARFDEEKLQLYNKLFLATHRDQFITIIKEIGNELSITLPTMNTNFIQVVGERSTSKKDIKEFIQYHSYLYDTPQEEIVITDVDKDTIKKHMEEVIRLCENNHIDTNEDIIEHNITSKDIMKILMPYADTNGRKEVLGVLRTLLSQKKQSVDPFSIIGIIGLDEVKNRLKKHIK